MPDSRRRRRASLLVVLLAALVSLAALPPVHAADTTPPTFESAEKINDTTILVVFADETNVSLPSVDAGDFTLSAGEIARVVPDRSGSRALVTIHLARAVPDNEVTVGLAPDATISDGAGNTLDPAEAPAYVIDGIDGVAPSPHLAANRTGAGDIGLTVTAAEPLTAIDLRVEGPVSDRLERSDLESTGNGTYGGTYQPPVDGTYVLVLRAATDRAGNTANLSQRRTVTIDTTPPNVDLTLDLAAAGRGEFAFEGTASDEHDIRGYRWDFGDGTAASGSAATHRFPGPGNYTVRLAVTDAFNNTGTASMGLRVPPTADTDPQPGDGNGTVTVRRRSGPAGASAIVSTPELAADSTLPLGTAAGGDPLVVGDGVTLGGLEITVAEAGGLALAVEGANASRGDTGTRAAGFAETTGATALGRFTVISSAGDDALSSVRFGLSVPADRVAAGPNASEARLYRRTNGTWTALPTSVDERANGTVNLSARSPGFSRFVLGVPANRTDDAGNASDPDGTATPPPAESATEPSLVVTNASLNTTAIPANGSFLVAVTVENRGEEPSSGSVGVTVDGRLMTTAPVVNVPDGGTRRTEVLVREVDRTGALPVLVNGTDAGTIEVGSGADDGGGLLDTILAPVVGLLGLLPLGPLQPLLVYVGLPLLVVYLLLKGLAVYLGY